ncbi:uncharacterized protein LOC119406110 [Rhipicephalus sanguineus]|uniref:uncharacterized protein LOC119406110 n=1 Tax=Rhipicephalus sanguineus TaxID=34632 RepID=UPI00189461F5|nr:uncharacterized protein LOC119406110 [Rhipicephalus sanguineus]
MTLMCALTSSCQRGADVQSQSAACIIDLGRGILMENQKWQWLPEETEGSLAFSERKSKGTVAHRKPAQLEHPWFTMLLFHQRGRSSSSEKLHALKHAFHQRSGWETSSSKGASTDTWRAS